MHFVVAEVIVICTIGTQIRCRIPIVLFIFRVRIVSDRQNTAVLYVTYLMCEYETDTRLIEFNQWIGIVNDRETTFTHNLRENRVQS